MNLVMQLVLMAIKQITQVLQVDLLGLELHGHKRQYIKASNTGVDPWSNLGEYFGYSMAISDKLNIKFAQEYGEITVSVRNTLGQIILTERYKSIDNIILNIKGNSGIYFVEISNEKGAFSTYKIIKK